ncbi:MAG TPA: nucleotidyltransferase family protein [Pirellulales bacterium]|jgi:D-glycero-alpha-D-manno-heptose 1-phosphate guanylyltransferase|nr:nucleotidyltransferase family protein [Pirellulales bacterium]
MAGDMQFDHKLGSHIHASGSPASSRGSACAVILAGGAGTRIRHLYPDLPKPMVPAAGAPFIEWVVRYLHEEGLTQFVISLGHLAAIAETYFASRPRTNCHVKTVREPAPLGTGGAFVLAAQATAECSDPLLLANGDSLVLADLSPAWRLLADDSVDGVVVGLEVDDASRYGGLETAGDGRLLQFSEKRPGAGLINAGVYLFRRRLLACFPSRRPLSMEQDVFPTLLSAGARLMVYRCQAPFLDIGTPASIQQADSFVRRHFLSQVAA